MTKIYYQKEANLKYLKDKTIAILGYGSQGMAWANNLRDSKIKVILGLRKEGGSWQKAKRDGFSVYSFEEASKQADFIHLLLPDELHKEVFEKIEKFITAGKTIVVSHGFNFYFKVIKPPKKVDVIMVAPKAPGPTVRREYINGFGVPALLAVYKNVSGQAFEKALALAHANGHTRVGVIKTTFKNEVESDLFGEQTVLCGGITELMKAGFETLVKNGYPAEIAYFECVHEMKLIVDLIYQKGIAGMYQKVSNTAKYGGLTVGSKIITNETKKTMRQILKRVQDGSFAKEWIREFSSNRSRKLKSLMRELNNLQIEKVGKKIRRLAGLEK